MRETHLISIFVIIFVLAVLFVARVIYSKEEAFSVSPDVFDINKDYFMGDIVKKVNDDGAVFLYIGGPGLARTWKGYPLDRTPPWYVLESKTIDFCKPGVFNQGKIYESGDVVMGSNKKKYVLAKRIGNAGDFGPESNWQQREDYWTELSAGANQKLCSSGTSVTVSDPLLYDNSIIYKIGDIVKYTPPGTTTQSTYITRNNLSGSGYIPGQNESWVLIPSPNLLCGPSLYSNIKKYNRGDIVKATDNNKYIMTNNSNQQVNVTPPNDSVWTPISSNSNKNLCPKGDGPPPPPSAEELAEAAAATAAAQAQARATADAQARASAQAAADAQARASAQAATEAQARASAQSAADAQARAQAQVAAQSRVTVQSQAAAQPQVAAQSQSQIQVADRSTITCPTGVNPKIAIKSSTLTASCPKKATPLLIPVSQAPENSAELATVDCSDNSSPTITFKGAVLNAVCPKKVKPTSTFMRNTRFKA